MPTIAPPSEPPECSVVIPFRDEAENAGALLAELKEVLRGLAARPAFRLAVAAEFIPIATLYSFMPALAVAAGFRVVEEPVRHRPRRRGASKYGLRVFLWRPALDMLGVWWFASRRVPSLSALAAACNGE